MDFTSRLQSTPQGKKWQNTIRKEQKRNVWYLVWFREPIFLDLFSCESRHRARIGRRLVERIFDVFRSPKKTLDNNDLNQVMRPAVLVKTRIWLGAQSHMFKKTWSRSLVFKDFRAHNTAEPFTGATRDQPSQTNFICSWPHRNSVVINLSLISYLVISVKRV